MGLGYRTAPATAPAQAPPASEVTPAQAVGNAETCEELGFGSTAPVGGGDVESLVDAVSILWAARVDGVDDVWTKAQGESPDNAVLDVLASTAAAVILAASMEVVGPVIAAGVATAGTSEAAKTVFDGAKDELVSSAQDGVKDTVTDAVDERLKSGAPTADGYFLGIKAGLRTETLSAMGAWRAFGQQVAALDNGAEVLSALTRAIAQRMVKAEATQMQHSLVGWMSVLACEATDRTPEEGSDLSKAGSGRSLVDQLLGRTPSGVVNLHVRYAGATETPTVVSADVSGINEALLGVLEASETPLEQLRLPIFVAGLTGTGGTLELGRNERGVVTVRGDEGGNRWLAACAAETGTTVDAAAADVIARVAGVPVSELSLEAT